MSACCDTPAFEAAQISAAAGQLKTVVLIGPPNSGKSTLFNRLTGLRQKVANFPGVTVEQRMGLMAGVGRADLTLIDLPGIYSLDPYSEDARVSIDVLRGKMAGTPKPDAVLLVLDSLHLTRQLMLAAPVLALGLPTLVLLNMSDLMEARGGHIDALKLARELGAPVAQISAVNGTGLDAVPLFLHQQTDRAAAKPLTLPVVGNAASAHSWAAQVSRRTGYRAPLSVEGTRKIDNILLHRIWGPLLFLVVVVGVFEVVFSIGQPLSDGFGAILADVGNLIRPLLPAGWIQSLILDGAWKGISSVLVFLPQILLLFLFIGILEDSGYLSRAALIADRVMRTTGLNGKAFIPLLSAYACAVPAIMATRTIENKRDRMATILVTPFMTCSARLPVYMLLIAAFIPNIDLPARLSRPANADDAGPLSGRLCGSDDHGMAAEELDPQVQRDAVHSGAAAVPHAHAALARSAAGGSRARLPAPGGHDHSLRHAGALGAGASAGDSGSGRRDLRAGAGRQPDRPAGPLHRAGDCAAGLQLEDRHWPALERAGARGDGQHHGHFVWRRCRHTGAQPANRAAPRHDAGRRAGADDLLRLRHAMHLDDGRGPARDQQLEVARRAVSLYAGAGLDRGLRGQPSGDGVLRVNYFRPIRHSKECFSYWCGVRRGPGGPRDSRPEASAT